MELTIAILSILISLFTLWVTYLHKGRIRMTRPTIICIAFEGIRKEPKVFLRTLLYSSSKQGVIVESLMLKLKRDGSTQVFSVWAYGDNDLVRGSGIYVSEHGVEVYHHFLPPKSEKNNKFLPGLCVIEMYAVIKDKKSKIYELQIEITEDLAKALDQSKNIMFDWNPDREIYEGHVQPLSDAELAYSMIN